MTLVSLRKLLTIILALAVFLSFGGLTFAQEEDATSVDRAEPEVKPRIIRPSDLPTKRKADVQNFRAQTQDRVEEVKERTQDRRENVQERVVDKREDLQERKEGRKDELGARKLDRISAYADRMFTRFEAAIERLERLSERIASRIEKLEERGLDLGEAASLLKEANADIEVAKENVAEAKTLVREALDSDNPKEAFKKVREILGEAKSQIKSAHQSLVEAIRDIKSNLPEPEEVEENTGDSEE